jgi:hypothetical protein
MFGLPQQPQVSAEEKQLMRHMTVVNLTQFTFLIGVFRAGKRVHFVLIGVAPFVVDWVSQLLK